MIYPRIWLPKYASSPNKLFSAFRLFCGAFYSVITETKAESNNDSDLSIMRQLAIHRVNSRKFSPPLSEWYSTKEKSIYRIDVELKIIPCLMRFFFISQKSHFSSHGCIQPNQSYRCLQLRHITNRQRRRHS